MPRRARRPLALQFGGLEPLEPDAGPFCLTLPLPVDVVADVKTCPAPPQRRAPARPTAALHCRLRRLLERLLAGGLLAVWIVGCEPAPAPQFTLSETAQTLLPAVRDGLTVDDDGTPKHLTGVLEATQQRFGTLADPTVWPQLPVDFGGVNATVAAVVAPQIKPAAADDQPDAEESDAEVPPPESVTLELTPSPGTTLPTLRPGAQVAFLDGNYENRAFRVASFEPATHRVTLTGTFDDGLPEAGEELLLDAGRMLKHGKKLYARHCLHCHGPGGAGNGPTAAYLFPMPRDYRLGVFKFTSTNQNNRASRDDLLNTLHRGIPGTSMPAFRLLGDDDLHALVEYVRWLAMRGEYELKLAAEAAADFSQAAVADRLADGETQEEIDETLRDFLDLDLAGAIDYTGEDLAEAWSEANDADAVVTPAAGRVADTPASRERGRQLYLSDRTKCASCHGAHGRGDGPQTVAFQLVPGTSETYPQPGLYDAWSHPIRPRDLTQGVYRGGRRPIDLYRRLHAGIKGTPMPAFGGTLSETDLWDLVNFILHVPYESLPEPGAGKPLAAAH